MPSHLASRILKVTVVRRVVERRSNEESSRIGVRIAGRCYRFFDNLGDEPVELERTRVVEAPSVTHLWFRVVKKG
jgi:hypothetical protein